MKAQLAFHFKNLKCKHMLVTEERHYPCISIRNPNCGITVLHVQSWKIGDLVNFCHPAPEDLCCLGFSSQLLWKTWMSCSVPLLPCGPATFLFWWIIVTPCDRTAWAWFLENDPPPRSHPRVPLTPIVPATTGSGSVWAPWALHSLPTLALILNSVFLV